MERGWVHSLKMKPGILVGFTLVAAEVLEICSLEGLEKLR